MEADGYGTPYASLDVFARQGGRWIQAFGPITAMLGYNGLAPAGDKHEGDGRTPSGIYALGPMFGVLPNPGVHFPYRDVTSRDVWVDDPQSRYYNEEERLPIDGRWRQEVCEPPGNCYSGAEALDNSPPYDYAAVVEYNVDPVVAGAGSAIFFHVGTTGTATVGCISIPVGELVPILDWLQPSAHPVMVLGTTSTITSF